ncbi:unnamed protein product [Lymnaea stagnalis]|uniref:ZNF451 PIN-like domain-containing protein n=1 Tax=Lymnaea stagnalis TaxID=6523 RepID=A0AAV2INN2_LYMST
MDQVILRPRDKYMANQHMKSTTSTMSLPDEVSIVISDDDHFVVTAESHINQSYQTPDDRLQNSLRSSDKKLDLLSAVGKKRFTRRRRFQTNKSKKKNLHKSHYKASQGKGLFSQLNFRTARFKAADLKSTGQFHFPPLVAPSLMLRLDGPQCCSSHSERQLGSAKSQSTTTVPKSAHFKKLISPQINHLASMERIIFADLENVMFFKVFSGSLSPSTYVWGFISARPNTPFHLEQYFCKYPLYNYLKDADCVHISTEIGTSKDAVDFAMCLAIAKLDDRLPASIPFFIVSRDRGFREVENQMRASHRLVKVISPQGWSISDLDFKL